MVSLDDAIERFKLKAIACRETGKLACAHDQSQIADWLSELKEIRRSKTLLLRELSKSMELNSKGENNE